MISVDTNVLVRLLVGDDLRQAERARDLIGRAAATNENVFLTHLVLCELVWVLAGAYSASRQDLVATLNRLTEIPPFVVEEPDRLRRAIDRYTAGRADFADYLLGETAIEAGATVTYTFDRALRDEEGFTLL